VESWLGVLAYQLMFETVPLRGIGDQWMARAECYSGTYTFVHLHSHLASTYEIIVDDLICSISSQNCSVTYPTAQPHSPLLVVCHTNHGVKET
jgi:hypothetical protein